MKRLIKRRQPKTDLVAGDRCEMKYHPKLHGRVVRVNRDGTAIVKWDGGATTTWGLDQLKQETCDGDKDGKATR